MSFDGTLSIERQAREVQKLRNEAAAGGMAVKVEFGDLEPRSTSWVERSCRRHESASGIRKTRPEKASKWIKFDGDPQASKQRSCTTESENV